MFEQLNNPFSQFGKQFADSALKINSLALENFERVMGLQLKTIEDRMHAAAAFMGEASEMNNLDSVKSIWPKGLTLLKETTEQFYSAGQEAFTQTLKTSEAIGQIVRTNFETVDEAAQQATGPKVNKTTSKPAANK